MTGSWRNQLTEMAWNVRRGLLAHRDAAWVPRSHAAGRPAPDAWVSPRSARSEYPEHLCTARGTRAIRSRGT
jgi:hypothetical protein